MTTRHDPAHDRAHDPAHEWAVELLDRALAYTRGALVEVRPEHLGRPTPCVGWDLDRLLVHMDDALDAFTESASGSIALEPSTSLEVRVTTLQLKACGLLGAWSAPDAPTEVRVGDLRVRTAVVVQAAALEIAVHGWDVAQATGHRMPLPDPLAAALRPVAGVLVGDDDRGVRFADPLDVDVASRHAARLLAFLGRRPAPDLTGPPGRVSAIHRTDQRSAS